MMHLHMRRALRGAALLSAMLLAAGCSSDDAAKNNGANNSPDMASKADMTPVVDMKPVVDMTPDQDMASNACQIAPSTLGPIAACGDAQLMGCFANEDCAADERCENLAAEGMPEVACCVKGPRGCLKPGEACADELSCESGLCVSRNDEPASCTILCDSDEVCPEALPKCNPGVGLCVAG